MKRILPFFVLFLTILNACQRDKGNADNSNTPATAIDFAQYYVRFLETERQIKAQASFFSGDSLPTASPVAIPGGVTFQGQTLELKTLPRTLRYLFNGSGDYAAAGFSFAYESEAGKQTRVLQMAPIIAFAISGTASQSKGMVLEMQSAPFQEGESLVLLFTNLKTNAVFTIEYRGLVDLSLVIKPEEMAAIEPGKYMLYLVKKQTHTTQEGSTAVTTEIEFYTKTIEIQIVK